MEQQVRGHVTSPEPREEATASSPIPNGKAIELPSLIDSYLQAARERDLDGCMTYFAEDAKLTFMSGIFEGKPAIEEWHKERFDADLQFIRIDAIKTRGDTVTVDAVVTSKRIKAWKIGTLGGRATFRIADGKIKETSFGLRLHNPLEGW